MSRSSIRAQENESKYTYQKDLNISLKEHIKELEKSMSTYADRVAELEKKTSHGTDRRV